MAQLLKILSGLLQSEWITTFIQNNVRQSECLSIEMDIQNRRILIYILLKKIIKIYHCHTSIEYPIKTLIPRKLFQLKFHWNDRDSTYFWSILSIHIFSGVLCIYLSAGGIHTCISNVHGYIMTSYYLKFNISMNVSCIYS